MHFMIVAGVCEEAIDEARAKRRTALVPDARLLLIGNIGHPAPRPRVGAENEAIQESLAAG